MPIPLGLSFYGFIKKARLLLILGFLFLVPGCATPPPDTQGSFLIPLTAPTDFPAEIARLQQVADSYSSGATIQTMPHLELALLYSHYKNPHPDYDKAIEELETFIFLDATHGNSEQVQNFYNMLKQLQEAKNQNKDMRASVQLLSEENQRLKQTLEELKKLDRQVEGKRRSMK